MHSIKQSLHRRFRRKCCPLKINKGFYCLRMRLFVWVLMHFSKDHMVISRDHVKACRNWRGRWVEHREKQRNGRKRDRNKGEGWGDRWFERWRRNAIKGNHPETPQSLGPCPSSKRPCVQQVTTALQLKVIRICHRVWFIIIVLRVYSRRKSWTNHIWTGKKRKDRRPRRFFYTMCSLDSIK